MSVLLRVVLCALLVAAGVIGPATAQGTHTVTRTDDPIPDGCAPGDCSLREAVVAANSAAGPDTVVVPAGTYTLSIPPDGTPDDALDGDLDLLEDITIIGAGAPLTVIDGAQIDRVVHVHSGSVDVSGATVRGGSTASSGGGLLNGGSQVTLRGVAIASNAKTGGAGDGGGIANTGVGAQLSILDSTFVGNSVSTNFGGDGGALANMSGASASLTNVTISANTANQGGGAIFNSTGTLSLTSSTITDNTAAPDAVTPGSTAGGGISSTSGTVSLSNTILAGNHDGDPTPGEDPDCQGAITSQGHNLVGSISAGCTFTPTTGDLTGDPLLGALADNGGPTMTHALLSGSSAVDGGAGCPPADQRGAPRAGACDIGAYELVLCEAVVVNRVGTEGDDSVAGTDGPDGVLALGGNDVASTGAGNDAVCAGDGGDTVLGEGGRDVLRGGSGNDRLSGGGQKDRLFGESGKDRLNGGSGKDRCRGGPGKDRNRKCEKGKP